MDTNLADEKPAELNRILIVDDEEIVLTALYQTLVREGYEPVCVAQPLEALSLVREQKFSVILTDQQMPALTGLEFLAEVKQLQPDATRILITAVLSLSTVIDAINTGEIYRFIVKPWLREELLATLRNAVHRYELVCYNARLLEQTRAMNDQLAAQLSLLTEQNHKLDGLNQALRQNLQQSVQLCLKTMETFYPLLGSQARRVFELCRALSDGLELSEGDRERLEISAWLHDVGLVGSPRQLIKKWHKTPAQLTEPEWTLIRQHPVLGAELIGFVHDLAGVGPIIRAHHEHFDGTGYPDQLSGNQIPWPARLLAVAVGYASIPTGGEAAVEFLQSRSGTVFDPEAVRAFVRVLPKAVVSRPQREVLLAELEPGMVLANGIYTANGMLLLPEGQVLSKLLIDKVRNHDRLMPITQSLLVFC